MISPCINICVLDPESELCEGCGRSLDEISQLLTEAEAELARINARRTELLMQITELQEKKASFLQKS